MCYINGIGTMLEKSKPKKDMKLLMAVFNPIEFDGRVRRAAETLMKDYQVVLFCPAPPKSADVTPSSDNRIKRSWLRWKACPTTISLAIFWLQFIHLALTIRPKIIYSHDFYLTFPGLVSAKLVGAVSIYDAHELIINPPIKMLIRDRIFYFLERMSVHHQDLVIAANIERAELMKEHYSLDTLPTPIRNISKYTLGSIDRATILQKYPEFLRKDGQRLIVYMGDISLSRGLSALIEAFTYLPTNVCLIVIGDGPDRWKLEKRLSDKKLNLNDRIKLIGLVPQLWVQDILSLCDVGVALYSMEGLNNYYCSPNKIFEYTQAGLPVVTTAQPVLLRIVNNYQIGKVVTNNHTRDDSKEFATSISEVLKMYNYYRLSINKFLRHNSWGVEQRRLQLEIHNIVSARYKERDRW